jgi:hypothetical protein
MLLFTPLSALLVSEQTGTNKRGNWVNNNFDFTSDISATGRIGKQSQTRCHFGLYFSLSAHSFDFPISSICRTHNSISAPLQER